MEKLKIWPFPPRSNPVSDGHKKLVQVMALCIRQTRTQTADADFVYSADSSRHVTIGTPTVIFAVLTVFW